MKTTYFSDFQYFCFWGKSIDHEKDAFLFLGGCVTRKQSKLLPLLLLLLLLQAQDDWASWLGWAEWLD